MDGIAPGLEIPLEKFRPPYHIDLGGIDGLHIANKILIISMIA